MSNPVNLNTKIESITGEIERVTYHNESNGFCVLRIKVKGNKDLITVTGNAVNIHPGEYIEANGFWLNDKNYGLQFKATNLKLISPNNLNGIEKYLGSGLIKGIGPHFAKVMVNHFGLNVIDIIDTNPELLLELPGIGQKRLAILTQSWQNQKAIRKIMLFLQSHGVGTARAVRIFKTYGENAIDIVTQNPYKLAKDIYGIGFKTADLIAQNIGIPKDSLIRAQAGLSHILQEASNQGHIALSKNDLIESTNKVLSISPDTINVAINQEIELKNLASEFIAEIEYIFLSSLYNAEQSLAKNLSQLNQSHFDYQINADSAIEWVESKNNISLSASQKQAVIAAFTNKILIITGGPGVGKTTIVNCIIQILAQKNIHIALTAPTGRAAKRLTETTKLEAKTIHRLLEFDPKINNFKKNKDNKLDLDLLIVDESSMIDIILMNKLIHALPSQAQLILIGDIDQLPAVGPGNVLNDLISSKLIKTIHLTQIFRQAAASQIITNAHLINQGEMINTKYHKNDLTDFYFIEGKDNADIMAKVIEVVSKRIPNKFKLDSLNDIQILTPMNRGSLGSRSLNIELQKHLNPNSHCPIEKFGQRFDINDKVIQLVNNYQKEVFNGDIGKIYSIDKEESIIQIDFDGKIVEYEFTDLDEINLAYATSIHKAQGSEYPCVVIPLAMQHYTMLQRNLIYTAITRGKKLVIIIGESKALYIAIKNKSALNRFTTLTYRLTKSLRTI